jgi:predicted MFS family arabinose efflux permease
VIERRSAAPLIRLGIFRVRSLAGANTVLLFVVGGLFAFFFFASLYVQQILGYSPLEAGLAFLPVTLGIGVGAGIAQQLVKRIGVRTTAGLGMLIAAFGLYLFSGASVDGSYLGDVLSAVIPQSIGMGLFFVPITLIATTNVGDEDAGLASGLFNTAQQVGGALGLAVLSTLAADKSASVLEGLGHPPNPVQQVDAMLEGFQVAFTAAAILVAFGALLLMLVVRRRDVANVDPDAAPIRGA